MTFKLKTRHALLAAALVTAPAAALAQDVEAQANQVAAEAQDLDQAANELATTIDDQAARDATAGGEGDREGERDRGDDDGFPWGLLGLLGLAGLLGLKGRDRDRHDHVDRTGYDRTTTGTRTTAGDTDRRL